MGKKVYDNPTDKLSALPDLDDKLSGLPDLVDGGTTPAEKKNEKPATVSPVGGGSSDLLSVKFGGEDYEVNPTTQEVFKGGKPVTVPAHIKDYIEKNIIGSKPKDKPAEKPYVAKGAVILPKDYFDKKAMPKETAWLISDLTGMDMTALQNSPQVVDEAFKDLSTYTGIAVDKTSNPETITKAIGQAKMLRDTKEFTKLAKDAGVTEKKALEIAYDNAADKFLDSGDKELWALTKQVNQAFEGGDKATVDKLMPVWEKARKQFIDNRHDKITSLHNMIITGKNVDGVPLTSAAIEDLKKEKNLLTKQLNGFFKSPEAVVKDVVGSTPMLSVFDKQLEGKTGQQKLETIAKPMLARYFLLGKKMGVKTEDIMGEGNTRFMQTDKTYLDDVKNYMGIGDYDGEVTSSDRKEFNDLHNKLGIIMPMLLINKIPVQDVEDKPVDILKKGALSMTPALATMNQTGQQKTNTLNDILALANITPDDLTQDALTSINTNMKKYGWAQDLAQMGGSTLSIMLPMMLAETGAGFAIESLALNPRTAMVANFLLKNPVGKVIKGGTTFSAAGKISDGEELDFGTGAASGVVDVVLDALGSRNITLAKWFINTFGKQATKYAAIAAKPLAKGTGEFFQESGETVYQAWRDTPEGKSVMETLQKQFPDADSRLKFYVGTTIMGGGMGLAGDIGFGGAKKRAYDALSPENKAKADAFMATRNQKAKDAVDEVVPVASNDAIEKNIKDAGEAKQKLQDIAKDVQSEDEVVTYSIEVDGVTYSGSTLQDLQRDIDFLDHVENTANDELYKRNTGQTQTPPIAEADQGDVELAKPEAGVGVEGEVVPEDVKKRITELEDMLSGDALSMQEKGMGTLNDRQSVVDELADLKKKYNIEPKPIAKAAPTFENVPVFTYTPQDVEKAKNEIFDNLSKLQVGSVIENSDGDIKVVTENLTSKNGNRLIGVVTFTRLEDGSLLQTTNPVFASKSADGKIKLDYNPHTTGRNAKEERVTVTDQITDKTIDLSKENIFIQDENGNLVKTNAFSTTTTQTAPQEGVTEPTKAPVIKAQVVGVGVEGEYTPKGIEEVKTEEIIPERVQTETTENLPQEGEVKETVEDTQVSEPTKLEEEIPFDIDNGFENQRKAGFIVEKGVKTNRKAPVKNKAVGKTVEVDFGLRDNPKAEYTVIEVDDIVPSHKNGQRNPEHFIPEAQPKNRSTAFDKASDNETIEIANNLKPERVAESPNAFSGAPVVNERGEVIQGNNRAESLRKHWLGQGAEYKQYLIDNAERLGINPDDIAKMKAPVLVRMTKVSDEGAIKLGQADVTDLETGGEKRLDPIKTANKIGLKDAKGLIDILADAPQDETLNQTIRRKAEALIDYLFRNGLVTRAQQASMIKNGVIVPRALEDIQNLFTQVLLKGSDPNLASIYENNTPNIVKQAIDKATPILLGLPKNVGITQNIQNALLGLDEFLKTGIDKVKEWANQPDMFNDGLAPQDIYSPLELVMIEQMAKAKRIIDVLNPIKEYAKLVTEQPATLFEEAAQPISKEQALKQVYGTEKSTLGTTERTPRLQEENGGTQQKPSGETTKGEAKSPTDREKTPPTEKVEAEPTADIDNVADKAGIAPKKAKKAAIQSDVIDKLVGKATDRKAAVENIADENIKEFAKAVTDTKVIDKVMDAIDNNDQLLADLEKKLGIKKICRI